MITLKYFAGLREQLNTAGETLEILGISPAVGTVAALRAHLAARGGAWVRLQDMKNLRCARNQEMAYDTTAIADGDEIAFFPPVTGG